MKIVGTIGILSESSVGSLSNLFSCKSAASVKSVINLGYLGTQIQMSDVSILLETFCRVDPV